MSECAPTHHRCPRVKGLLFPKAPTGSRPQQCSPCSLSAGACHLPPCPPGLCQVEETWCHSKRQWQLGPTRGTSSGPPALVSPAIPHLLQGYECHQRAQGGMRELGSLSPRWGPGPRDGPWVSSLVPAEGYLTHATASQVISRPFSPVPSLEWKSNVNALPGSLFSADDTDLQVGYRWIPMTFPRGPRLSLSRKRLTQTLVVLAAAASISPGPCS